MRNLVLFLTALGVAQAPLRAQSPTITNQPVSRTVWAGANVTLAVGVSGAGPFAYQWQLNGTNLPNRIIITVAGNGTWGCSGDGGTATNASLNHPGCGVVDPSGNLFIADSENNRIRKVTRNQGPTLALTNVIAANAGSYQLVVTSPGGSAASSPGRFYRFLT